jgi:hypothetical protein
MAMKRLPIIFAVLFCVVPAHATISLVQHVTGCSGNATPCSLAVSSTTAGNLLVGVGQFLQGSNTMTSITGGTSVHPAGCAGSDASGGSSDVAYVLSATGGDTTITFTGSTSFAQVDLLEYHSTNGVMAFDVCANRDQNSSASNIAGVSPGTLTGSSDVIIQHGQFVGNATGCPNSSASPADFPNSNAICGLMNTTNNAAGTYTNTAGNAGLGAVAFKEASLAGTSPATQSSVVMGGP